MLRTIEWETLYKMLRELKKELLGRCFFPKFKKELILTALRLSPKETDAGIFHH